MSYDKELGQKLKTKVDNMTNVYKISVAKDYAVVEGHKGILYFGEDRISLRLKAGQVELIGEKLSIATSQKGEIVIKGKVRDVHIEGADK